MLPSKTNLGWASVHDRLGPPHDSPGHAVSGGQINDELEDSLQGVTGLDQLPGRYRLLPAGQEQEGLECPVRMMDQSHEMLSALRRDWNAALARLVKAVRAAKVGANPLPPPMRAASKELQEAIAAIVSGQKLVTDALGRWELDKAAEAQTMLDEFMPAALAEWPLDPMIVKLDGYHIKNGYMVRHWRAVQSGRGPADPALRRSEQRFFEALWLEPTDPSGLDGLGSILMLRRDLKAAEFFFLCAIDQAERRGFRYEAAEENLTTVRRFLR